MKLSSELLEQIIEEEITQVLSEFDATNIVDFFRGAGPQQVASPEGEAKKQYTSPLTSLQQAEMAYKIVTNLRKVASTDKKAWAKVASPDAIEKILKSQIDNYQEKDGRRIVNIVSTYYSYPDKLLTAIKKMRSLQSKKQQSSTQAKPQQSATITNPTKPILSGPLKSTATSQQQAQGKKWLEENKDVK